MASRLKRSFLYSYSGIAAGGLSLLAVLELLSLAIGKRIFSPVDILRFFVPVSGACALFLAVSTLSLVRHEGFHPGNLVGAALGLIWTAGNLLCLGLRIWGVLPVITGFTTLLGCYVDFFLSGLFLLAFLAAKHRPSYDKDFVIIPGCSISKKGGLLPLLKGRTNRAIRFAWDQEIATEKPARYVPTGGQGPDEVMSEGSAMEFYLLSHGAEQYEILAEKKSTNTYENLLFSKNLIDAAMPGARTCFVTTNYHVLRTGMLAKKIGLDAEGLASSTKWYFWPNGLAREVVAITVMHPVFHLEAAGLCLICSCILAALA